MSKVIKFPFRKFSSLLGLSLMVITLFFYKPIYAAELPQTEIIGVDYNIISYSQSINNSGVQYYNYTYEVEIKLKDNYVGVIDGTLTFNWMNQDTSTGNPTSHNSSNKRKSYVNGNSFKTNIVIQGIYSTFTGKGPLTSVSYLVDNSDTNVVKYQDLDSIETVVNLLQDIYQNSTDIENLSTNQLDELENIVSNTSLANDYLDTISKLKQWNMPIESYPVNFSFFNDTANINKFDFSTYNYSYFNYPVIKPLQSNLIVGNAYLTRSNNYYDFIIGVYGGNYNGIPNISSDFVLNQGYYSDFKSLYFSNGFRIFKIRVNYQDVEGNYTITFNKTRDFILFGLFRYAEVLNNNFSTDYALQFGYSNSFLDNIQIVANGTNQSNSSASGTESTNNSLVQSQNQLFSQEDNFNQNMNDSLNQIDTNFSFDSKFGSSFIRSSEWVKTQFDRITGSTPFGSILGFSLLLGVGLLLIGKVLG